MYYEINVSLNGKHFFATAERSILHRETLIKVYNELAKRFPASEGYDHKATCWTKTGHDVDIAENEKLIGIQF